MQGIPHILALVILAKEPVLDHARNPLQLSFVPDAPVRRVDILRSWLCSADGHPPRPWRRAQFVDNGKGFMGEIRSRFI